MNDKMIPYEELRSAVREYEPLVKCVAINMDVTIKMPTNEEMLTQQMLSELEWALRSAETYLPTDLHHEFQVQFLKRWEKYFLAIGNCEYFDIELSPSPYVLQKRNRCIRWATAFIRQNSKQFDDIMNKQRRKDLENITKCLLGILKLTDKKEVINIIEQVISDLDLAKDEEEMAKDSLPDNFFLTERYEDMENNVNDLYNVIASVEDILDDVKSLRKYDVSVVKEQVDKVVEDIKTVIKR